MLFKEVPFGISFLFLYLELPEGINGACEEYLKKGGVLNGIFKNCL
jgi:hypothetical protein